MTGVRLQDTGEGGNVRNPDPLGKLIHGCHILDNGSVAADSRNVYPVDFEIFTNVMKKRNQDIKYSQ